MHVTQWLNVRVAELINPSNLKFLHFNQVFRVPSQVTGLSLFKAVKSGVPALRANWTAPQSDPTISKYLVHYRKTRTTVWGSELTIPGSPPLTSTILIRLDAATEYDVRVSAVSAAGNGMWSEVQTERTYGSESLRLQSYVTDNGTTVLMVLVWDV